MSNDIPEISTETVKTWDEFVHRIQKLPKQFMGVEQKNFPVPYIYRGHSNSDWPLSTTLERYSGIDTHVLNAYQGLILRCAPEIESFTGNRWDLKALENVDSWKGKDFPIMEVEEFPCIDYMVYLRHHGFPSPLLDWSRSAFVAAFFAFEKAEGEGHVSVFAYCERPLDYKKWGPDDALILQVRQNLRTHKRHFLQQSEYTICTSNEGGSLCYVPHELVLKNPNDEQDILTKFNIPKSERAKALKYLDLHNINAFSLYGSEESLCSTLALRQYKITPWDVM